MKLCGFRYISSHAGKTPSFSPWHSHSSSSSAGESIPTVSVMKVRGRSTSHPLFPRELSWWLNWCLCGEGKQGTYSSAYLFLFNLVWKARLHSIHPTFLRSSLIVLNRRGGTRPIAVGHTLWHMAAQCTGITIPCSQWVSIWYLPQLGFGALHGAEAIYSMLPICTSTTPPPNYLLIGL